jgi:CheY-like chemotaxis protein
MAGGGDRKLILLVEDDEMVRWVTAEELRERGFEVVEATSADEAMSTLSALPRVDLLFTDIRMPGRLDGWDLAEQVRLSHPSLPILYASGYSPVPARIVPGAQFLEKPYNPSALALAIDALI